ncbi:MAG: GNAT family N-acetyltransferase [Chloroflexi bacterium]|nr:GNAT family N-acetyltransferase [Chloroflexota bacterium]
MESSTTVKIRAAENADREQVQELWAACGLSQASESEWGSLLGRETSAMLLAADGDEIVGSAIASFDGWRAYIYHVAVAEEHRRRGIAFDLLATAEEYLLGAGARHVYVMVNQENTEGLALVGSQGYLPEGEIVLVKPLAAR